MREYGDAIRDLAIANIFPGDMLWRNFGVDRHGRVVFYDYDEIEYLTDCTFRAIPPAPNPEAELSGEPWYRGRPARRLPGGVRDVPARRPARCARRSSATTPTCSAPEFWQECQRRVAAGEMVDFFPYPEEMRFAARYGAGRRLTSRAIVLPSSQSLRGEEE